MSHSEMMEIARVYHEAKRAVRHAAGSGMRESEIVDEWKARGLSTRAAYCLAKAGVRDRAGLEGLCRRELLAIPGIGRSTMHEIAAFLKRPDTEGELWEKARRLRLMDFSGDEILAEVKRRLALDDMPW